MSAATNAFKKDPFKKAATVAKAPSFLEMREILHVPYKHEWVEYYKRQADAQEGVQAAVGEARASALARGFPHEVAEMMAARAATPIAVESPLKKCLITLGRSGSFKAGGQFFPIFYGFNKVTREKNPTSFDMKGMRATSLSITPGKVEEVEGTTGVANYKSKDCLSLLTRFDDKTEEGAAQHELAEDLDSVIFELLYEQRATRLGQPNLTREALRKQFKGMLVHGGKRKVTDATSSIADLPENYADNLLTRVRDWAQYVATFKDKLCDSKKTPGVKVRVVTECTHKPRIVTKVEDALGEQATHFRQRLPVAGNLTTSKLPLTNPATGETEVERDATGAPILVNGKERPIWRHVGIQDTNARCTYDIQMRTPYVSFASNTYTHMANAEYITIVQPDPGCSYEPAEDEIDADKLAELLANGNLSNPESSLEQDGSNYGVEDNSHNKIGGNTLLDPAMANLSKAELEVISENQAAIAVAMRADEEEKAVAEAENLFAAKTLALEMSADAVQEQEPAKVIEDLDPINDVVIETAISVPVTGTKRKRDGAGIVAPRAKNARLDE